MEKIKKNRQNSIFKASIVLALTFLMMFSMAKVDGKEKKKAPPIPDLCPGSGIKCEVEGVPGIPGGSQKGKDDGAIVIIVKN